MWAFKYFFAKFLQYSIILLKHVLCNNFISLAFKINKEIGTDFLIEAFQAWILGESIPNIWKQVFVDSPIISFYGNFSTHRLFLKLIMLWGLDFIVRITTFYDYFSGFCGVWYSNSTYSSFDL